MKLLSSRVNGLWKQKMKRKRVEKLRMDIMAKRSVQNVLIALAIVELSLMILGFGLILGIGTKSAYGPQFSPSIPGTWLPGDYPDLKPGQSCFVIYHDENNDTRLKKVVNSYRHPMELKRLYTMNDAF